ncbi:hypothetical protein [Salibacterium salarium]|uniref:hypothetical protein n=1 Tax=Salibacterium salarium TaxID=284579 RepID=UPI0027D784D0|nr:hypothetical protein [Salibacterium salarium]
MLDPEHIVHCYKRYFNNVLIIPYELLKTDESLFWGAIAERFQVPHPEVTINHAINTSLDLKRTFLLSKTNKISSVLLNTLCDSKDYTNMQEKNQIVSNYGNSGKWVHRRFVEYAAAEQVDEMYRLLGMSKPREDFFDVKLPRV